MNSCVEGKVWETILERETFRLSQLAIFPSSPDTQRNFEREWIKGLYVVPAVRCAGCTLCRLYVVPAVCCAGCTFCRLYVVLAVRCACCTLCRLYVVLAVRCACCTLCRLYVVPAVRCAGCTATPKSSTLTTAKDVKVWQMSWTTSKSGIGGENDQNRTGLLQMPDCWLEVNIRKVLRPATSTQAFLGFLASKSECWDGSQDSKLPLEASHVALQN
jgi:hypothetical protein